jgi:hypothetical protein
LGIFQMRKITFGPDFYVVRVYLCIPFLPAP